MPKIDLTFRLRQRPELVLQQVLLVCIDHGYVYAEDILHILGRFRPERVEQSLSRLLEHQILDIDDANGRLVYSAEFSQLVELSRSGLLRGVHIGVEETGVFDDPRLIGKVLETLGIEHPDCLARGIEIEIQPAMQHEAGV